MQEGGEEGEEEAGLLAPILSLDDLVSPTPSKRPYLFTSCYATAEEASACFTRCLRCLSSPILPGVPSHHASSSLALALAAELSLSDPPTLPPPLPHDQALSRAIADAEAQLAACEERRARLASCLPTRLLLAEQTRLDRREEELTSVTTRLRAQLARESRLGGAGNGGEGSSPLPKAPWAAGVVRSLSFEKRKKAAKKEVVEPPAAARRVNLSFSIGRKIQPTEKQEGTTFSRITRSLSFDKKKKAAPSPSPQGAREKGVVKGRDSEGEGGLGRGTIAAEAEPLVHAWQEAPRSFEVLLFALISISQRRLADLGDAYQQEEAESQGDGGSRALPLNSSGGLKLLDPEGAGV
ncbi:MAG: hypothetical protein SGPRY_008998 [Prymnesium sp.]